jgi:hypothetical protein
MKLWSIRGNSQRLDGGAFGNAPRALWEKWAAPDELNRIELACRALLASPLEGKTVLFETGIGAFFDPRMRERYGVQESQHVLIDSARSRFEHEDIDVVVLSHLHFDHAGGLLAAWSEGREPELLFPNATLWSVRSTGSAPASASARPRQLHSGAAGLLQASGRLEWWTASIRRCWAQRALQLQRWPHAGVDAGRDRRRRTPAKMRTAVFCADLIPALMGARADHHGLRPQCRAADRREAAVP